jgi:SNF2 family DNA or RNA helicase
MGLGKTVIAIALIVANPPPPHLRVLPREHVWSLEKKTTVDHPVYVPPPSGALSAETAKLNSTDAAKFSRLLNSNGTLIIVPMTLLR